MLTRRLKHASRAVLHAYYLLSARIPPPTSVGPVMNPDTIFVLHLFCSQACAWRKPLPIHAEQGLCRPDEVWECRSTRWAKHMTHTHTYHTHTRHTHTHKTKHHRPSFRYTWRLLHPLTHRAHVHAHAQSHNHTRTNRRTHNQSSFPALHP